MDEKSAIDLLGKLKNFMEDTNKQIETLIFKVNNQQIDIDKLKKHSNKERIILSN